MVIRGTEIDGLIFTGKHLDYRPGFYNIALYTRRAMPDAHTPIEGHGFHFIRQNPDGKTWSHKFSNMNVSDLDFAGKPITDPEHADFRTSLGNYDFIGYLKVPKGGIDIDAPLPHKLAMH